MNKVAMTFLTAGLLFVSLNSRGAETPRSGPSVDFSHGPLEVAFSRHLQHEDRTRFFYLADTAWELFHRLNKEEAEKYLENRRERGFTVIQAVVLAELDGLNTPNANGDKPLIDNDPGRPNEAYFQHVDTIVNIAKDKGIVIGMLPTWGDKVVKKWGVGPVIFEATQPEKIHAYGKFLGARYKNHPNIIWILGGDRNPETGVEIWNALAKGLEEGEEGGIDHLMTYHPMGGSNSATWFHNSGWLDFNMIQSGHGARNSKNYEVIQQNLQMEPPRPTLDGEPNYEDHPVNWDPKNGWFDDYDVRKLAYWSVFAGACGHTYGCHDIWQMWDPKRPKVAFTRTPWYEAINLPAAWDMMHLRNLVESRPYISAAQNPSMITSGQGEGGEHVQIGFGSGPLPGSEFLFAYIPTDKPVTLRTNAFHLGKTVRAWWFDPRTGEAQEIGVFENSGEREFVPPAEPKEKNDWVLVLDNAEAGYGAPGQPRTASVK